MPRVKNIKGTAGKTCYCDTWIDHWYNHGSANRFPKVCSTVGCNNKDLVGAHVRRYDAIDDRHYIVPLCRSCNQSENILDVRAELVSANVAMTCGKP